MLKLFSNLKVRQKLSAMVILFIVGFLIFGIIVQICLNMVKVKGSIYNNIVQGKDLIADILPPPEYIIESYLLVFQMADETDKTKISEFVDRIKTLENDYATRHEFWIKDLTESDMKNIMIEESYDPAQEFFDVVDKEFIPAVEKGDLATAQKLIQGVLEEKYEQHRAAIDKVVEMATERNKQDEAVADSTVLTVTLVLIGIGLLVIILTIVIYTLIRKSFAPLSETTLILKNIAEGEGDLTKRITVKSNDEIGDMANYFNRFIDKVQDIVKNIYDTTAKLSKTSQSILNVSEEMTEISKQTNVKTNLVGATADNINSNTAGETEYIKDASENMTVIAATIEEISGSIGSLASVSERISANVAQVNELADRISKRINNVSDSSRDVSSSVGSVATSMKEINISLNEVSQNCERSRHITSDASNKANDTNTIISNLDVSSRQIEKIINVINDIADQTNMLALNAAIEAAGAGEAGKGFAVVANEVKELAKQTSEATDEISLQIETMQGNMSSAVKAVGSITEVIREISLITNTIAAAVTQQSAIVGEISNSVVQASNKVNQITGDIGSIAENSGSMAESITSASRGVNEVARSAMELAKASNDASRSVDKVSSKVREVTIVSKQNSLEVMEISKNIHEITVSSLNVSDIASQSSEYARVLSDISKKLDTYVKQFKI
jgi:methyl-accepting chemotaxis protein